MLVLGISLDVGCCGFGISPREPLWYCSRAVSEAFQEILDGETLLRQAPGTRHEKVAAFLHEQVGAALKTFTVARLLPTRTVVQLSPGTLLRPDLTVVTAATGKPWLVAEVVDAQDHRIDTVLKKTVYEEANLPRLWMIDPRYDNLEVYHGSEHGLVLRRILAGADRLEEKLLPGLSLTVAELFAR